MQTTDTTATVEKSKRSKSKRNPNGQGTIKQRADGRWVGAISGGFDQDGKRIRKWIYGKTQGEVLKEMHRLKDQKLKGVLVKTTRTTVAQWLEHWLTNIAPFDSRKPCRPTTIVDYRKSIRLYVNPHLGGIRLDKLTPETIAAWHMKVRNGGVGEGTLRIAHSILCRSLNIAVKRGVVAFNPCIIAGRPGLAQKEMQALTPEQAVAFITAAKADRLYALYVLALTGGMRQGELFALKRDDIDLEGGTVTVRRTLVHQKGGFVENAPKSKAGRRTVTLPEIAVDALRDHYRRLMAEGHAGAEYVFCNERGGPLWRSNVRRQSLRLILERAGLPGIRFHDLRHSSATLLLAAGENIKVVSERLGHGDVRITLAAYTHVLPGMDKAAAGRFDTMLATPAAG